MEKEIIDLIAEIKEENRSFASMEIIKKDNFYSKYNKKFDQLKEAFDNSIKDYQNSLNLLVTQLEKRKNDIINGQEFEAPTMLNLKIIQQ